MVHLPHPGSARLLVPDRESSRDRDLRQVQSLEQDGVRHLPALEVLDGDVEEVLTPPALPDVSEDPHVPLKPLRTEVLHSEVAALFASGFAKVPALWEATDEREAVGCPGAPRRGARREA